MLGGNASSEVRLWILGATCAHGQQQPLGPRGRRDRRDPGREPATATPRATRSSSTRSCSRRSSAEPNITLLLNTAVYDARQARRRHASPPCAPSAARTRPRYEVDAPLFCDASGDGIVGFLAGAAFRMGAESQRRVRREVRARRRTTANCSATRSTSTRRTPAGRCGSSPPSFALQGHHQDPALARRSTPPTTAATCGGSSGAAASTRSTRPRRSSGSCGRSSTASGTTSRTPASSPRPRT